MHRHDMLVMHTFSYCLTKALVDRHPGFSRTLFLKHVLEMEFNIIALQLIT